MDNFLTGSPDNIAAPRATRASSSSSTTSPTTSTSTGRSTASCTSPAPPRPVDYLELPIQTLKVGALGTHNALGLAKAKGAGFLLASTSEVYGDPLVHPQREDYWGNVNPVGPRGVYDEAKRFAEAMTMAYHRTTASTPASCASSTPTARACGCNDGRVIPDFIGQALRGEPLTVFGDGSPDALVSATSSDLVEGIWRLMQRGVNEPVNIGNPHEMTMLAVRQARSSRLTGSRSEIVFRPLPEDDPKVRQPDITRARTLLGWEPRVDIDEGLARRSSGSARLGR